MSIITDLSPVFKKFGDSWCKERGGTCDHMQVRQDGYEQYQIRVHDMRIEYYDDLESIMVPDVGGSQLLTNNTSVEQTQTIKISKTTTNNFTWSLKEGFKAGLSVKFKAGVPPIASGETTMSAELNFESTQANSKTEQRAWEVDQPVMVPPKTEVEAKLLIDQKKFSQSFHSKCILTGYVCSTSPNQINGHYFWFHHIANILSKYPQPGFTVKGDHVLYQGDGQFKGLMGVRTNINLKERPLGNKNIVSKEYNIVQPLAGAGIAGVHDAA